MKYDAGNYDVAVIGAGHAGCEAALAAARMGMKTVIFSISLEAVANMPCNPHIGGSSKGHLVREIDALGGEMAKNIDKTFDLTFSFSTFVPNKNVKYIKGTSSSFIKSTS